MEVFKQTQIIDYGDCDEQGRLELPFLVEYMMEVSNIQLAQKGAGINDLMAGGLGWVVIDYNFTFKRLPQAGEKVVFTTNASGYNRFFVYRDFGVEDANGEKIIDVKSQWVILDLKTRKGIAPDPKFMVKFDNPELARLPHFKRSRQLKEWDHDQPYRVRYYDLDTNHHLTNSRYFDWMVDVLPRDFLNAHQPEFLNITFKKEVKYGQEAQSLVKIDKEKLVTSHEIKNGSDVAALATIGWQSN